MAYELPLLRQWLNVELAQCISSISQQPGARYPQPDVLAAPPVLRYVYVGNESEPSYFEPASISWGLNQVLPNTTGAGLEC